MTGCGSAGVNASPLDKKLSVSPSVPQWAMDVIFFPLQEVSIWNWFWLVPCCQLRGIIQQWSCPTATATTHKPPTFTEWVWTKLASLSAWWEHNILPTLNVKNKTKSEKPVTLLKREWMSLPCQKQFGNTGVCCGYICSETGRGGPCLCSSNCWTHKNYTGVSVLHRATRAHVQWYFNGIS